MEITVRKTEGTEAEIGILNNALHRGLVGTYDFYFGFIESEDSFELTFEASDKAVQVNFLQYIDTEFQIVDIKFDESGESQFLNKDWRAILESADKQVEATIKPEPTIEPSKKKW